MSTMNFQRKAVTVAVAGMLSAGISGVANAAPITGGVTKPTLDGSPFFGANSSKVRVTATTVTAEAAATAVIRYYDASDTFISASLAVVDSDADADILFDLTVDAPAGATQAAIIINAGGTDTIGGGTHGFVNKSNGALTGAADEAAAITAAETGGAGLLPIDGTYQRITIVDANLDDDSTAKLIYATFNADPNIAAGALTTSNGTDKLLIKAGLTGKDTIVSNGAAGTPAEGLATNIKVLMFADGTNVAGELTADVVAFDAVPTEISNASGLDDGAGNVATAPNTITPIEKLSAPGYGDTGMVAILEGDADDLYGDSGAEGVTDLYIRMDKGVDAASFTDATLDIALINAASSDVTSDFAVVEVGVSADANGKNTILHATLNPNFGKALFVDPATGGLLFGNVNDRDGASALSVRVVRETADGPLALELNNSVEIADDLAVQGVMAGSAQDPVLITRDDDKNGWVDGGVLDMRQDLSGLPSDANLGLISYAPGVLPTAGTTRVNLDTDAAAFVSGSNSQIILVLTNPDTPKADGTAPDGDANNDYNGDATADETDAALVVKANFNTGVDSTLNGGPGVPFAAMIGNDDFDNPTTSLTYARVYNAQTGDNLAVDPTGVEFSQDGAAPVVQSVEYFETHDAEASEADGYDRSGTVTIQVSESVRSIAETADAVADSINEFLFGGVPSDLINLAANIENKVVIGIDDPRPALPVSDVITLTDMPRTVIGSLLSLGVTGGAEDAGEAKLFCVAGVPEQCTVVEAAPPGPSLKAVKFMQIGEEWHIGAKFSQAISAPAGYTPADFDAMFTVRALIGWDHEDQSNSDGGEDTSVFQFVIPGANVTVGGAAGAAADGWVTLMIPGGGLPGDTTKVAVDYQGASAAEIADGSLKYLQNAEGTEAKIDGGSQFDDDDSGVGVDVSVADTFDDTEDDEDTRIAAGTEAPYFNGGTRTDDQRNLFTQTIRGMVYDNGGEVFPDGTAVRVDVVRLKTWKYNSVAARKAVVGNGYIDIRQGSNSEFEEDCDCELDSWVTYGLLNKAVTGADFDAYDQAVADVESKEEALESAWALNRDSKTIASLQADLQRAEDRLATKWPDGRKLVFVEVTHGDGSKAPDGAYADYNHAGANGNASFGRTATLLSELPNKRINGTSYYPAYLDMDNGTLSEPGGENNIDDGHLEFVKGRIAESGSEKTHFEVLDTAYDLVKDGKYQVTVGVDEESLNKSSKGLTAEAGEEACVLVSVKRSTRESWDGKAFFLANSCDPSFNSHIPFAPDIEGNGKVTVFNPDLSKVSRKFIFNDSDWQLLPITGTMDRKAKSGPLDLPRFFLQVRPSDGAPVSLFGHDHGYGDAVFTMGLGDKPGAMQLAFELGDSNDNVTVGSVNPAPGAAIGFRSDQREAYYAPTDDTEDYVRGVMDNESYASPHRLYVPINGAAQNAKLVAGWHLVSAVYGDSIADLISRYPGIGAVIAFHSMGVDADDNPILDADSGRDDEGDKRLDGDQDTTVWFQGDEPNAAPFNNTAALFIYTEKGIDSFNILP